MRLLCRPLSACIIAMLVASGAYCDNQSKPKVITTSVEQRDLYDVFYAVAECKMTKRKDIYINAGGVIDFISKNEGSHVKKGEVILAIDADLAKTNKAQAYQSYHNALNSFQRGQRLHNSRIISEEALEDLRLKLDAAKLSLEKALTDYDRMIIAAPFDGIVGVVRYIEGDQIRPNDNHILTIVGDSKSKVLLMSLPSSLYGKVDNSSIVKLTAFPSSNVKITSVSPYLNRMQGTFNVKAYADELDSPDNSFVNVQIMYNKHAGLVVPQDSISRNNAGNFVYVCDGSIVKKVYVQLGTYGENVAEIISPEISKENKVVLYGLQHIADKQEVEVTEHK